MCSVEKWSFRVSRQFGQWQKKTFQMYEALALFTEPSELSKLRQSDDSAIGKQPVVVSTLACSSVVRIFIYTFCEKSKNVGN